MSLLARISVFSVNGKRLEINFYYCGCNLHIDNFLVFIGMDDLAKLWGKFSLGEKESTGVSLDTPELNPLVKRGRTCLVGKL
jgi:hypothetical protein